MQHTVIPAGCTGTVCLSAGVGRATIACGRFLSVLSVVYGREALVSGIKCEHVNGRIFVCHVM